MVVSFYTGLIILGFFLSWGSGNGGAKHIESLSVAPSPGRVGQSLGWTCQSEGAFPGKGFKISQPELAFSKGRGREAGTAPWALAHGALASVSGHFSLGIFSALEFMAELTEDNLLLHTGGDM